MTPASFPTPHMRRAYDHRLREHVPAAFSGQTPDEMYYGTTANLPAELATARIRARDARLDANRAMSCDRCLGQQPGPAESRIPP